MLSKVTRIWALLCVVLVLQLATAQSFRAVRRDDSSIATSTIPPTSSQPTATGKPDNKGGNGKSTDASESHATTKGPDGTKSTTASAATATITSTNGFENSTYFNATIPAGEIPIKPEITPGWGVAGIIMLLTGLIYTLIGIKNRFIHSFFSSAFIVSLGVTVLIVYVMSVPISNAVQGGYVVAIVMSGCALGAASMFFKELTEGLGCALGGFCVSMWLLCLVPGGLLHNTAAKAIFIACFTLVGFCFYFSRYTRDWAMILLMSFAGATVTILGLDCFSKAGLKEFWAYVWNLNDNLFPLGADTYPVTKGIRVETAAIVIICLVGIISQIKLWRIVREKREKRAAERAEGQRNLEEEEENVGRQIQEQTARDRSEWERVYGDGTLPNGTVSGYSDTGDGISEKRLTRSHPASVYTNSKAEGIEMTEMSDLSPSRADGLMSSGEAEEGKIMVRVAADAEDVFDEKAAAVTGLSPEAAEAGRRDSKITVNGKRISQTTADSRRGSRQQAVLPAPEVVPLPFKVPVEEETKSIGDRSSVATFADEDEVPLANPPRHSLVKRLSQNSVTLLRSLSQRSRNPSHERQLESGESSEDLVEPATFVREDDRSSLAATVDYESVSGADRRSILTTDNRKSIEFTAELGKEEQNGATKENGPSNPNEPQQPPQTTEISQKAVPFDADKKAKSTDPVIDNDNKQADEPVGIENPKTRKKEDNPANKPTDANEDETPESVDKAKSAVSSASTPVNLTKDRLPRSLSKVALSYRTNEWAKHLSNADVPEPDDIVVEPIGATSKASKEVARSVDVEDLQKSAEDGALPPAIKRSDSQVSSVSAAPQGNRVVSSNESPSHLNLANTSHDIVPSSRSPTSPLMVGTSARPSSVGLRRTSSGFAPIAEENDRPTVNSTIPEETSEQGDAPLSPTPNQPEVTRPPIPGVVSFSSPQTLLGQRETFLRHKSQGNLLAHTPEPPVDMHKPASDAGSLYNYPVYAAAFNSDPDDLPLSHRKEMMRQSSMMSLTASNHGLNRPTSGLETSDSAAFNSHQPKRISSVPTTAAREAKLANFRQSVAQDLRSGTPGTPGPGRETPFGSTSNLLAGVDSQRSLLLEQRDAEAQRREMQRREKEWQDQMFDSRMRSGDLLDAHREVLRKMQNSAKNS